MREGFTSVGIQRLQLKSNSALRVSYKSQPCVRAFSFPAEMWDMGETRCCTTCPGAAEGFDLFSSRGLVPIFVLLLTVS